MNYVMVPVPEEYTDEVHKWLRWNARPKDKATPSFDPGLIRSILDDLDDQARALVEVTTRALRADRPLSIVQVARSVGTSAREAVGTMVELNATFAQRGGPPFALAIQQLPGVPGDRPWAERMTLGVTEQVADVVQPSAASPA